MKVAQYAKYGIPNQVIELVDREPVVLTAGQVRCRVLAAPINPSDLLSLTGDHAFLPQLPAIGGNEGVGRVVEVAHDVTSLICGQMVMLPFGAGTWQTEVVAREEALVSLPDDANPLQLSMLSINPLTALLILENSVPLTTADWVVQNAANSAVGEYVIQLAKLRGLRTCNIVRREGLAQVLQSRGADLVLMDGADLSDRIREATGGTACLGIDAIGGVATQRVASGLADGALVVSYGQLSGDPCYIAQSDLIFRRIRLEGFWLAAWARKVTPGQRTEVYARLATLVEDGKLEVRIEKTYPLDEIRAAIEHAMKGGRNGKIVVVPS